MTATESNLPDMPGHLIRRLNQRATAVFQDRLSGDGHDITSVQFAALDTLRHQPGLDQASLAAVIGYDRATIGGVVQRLEQKGLIRREVDEKDRRARRLALTPDGQAVLDRIGPIVEALQDEILGNLSDTERAQFVALARKAIAA